MLPVTIKTSRKQFMVPLDKCKTKAIQTDLGTFRHDQELFRHIQNPV